MLSILLCVDCSAVLFRLQGRVHAFAVRLRVTLLPGNMTCTPAVYNHMLSFFLHFGRICIYKQQAVHALV